LILKYSIAQIFGIAVIVAIALSLRAFWISSQSDAFTLFATIVIAIVSGSYAGLIRGRLLTVALASLGSAVALSSTFSLERVFHSPDAMFPRNRIDTFYFDDPQTNFMAVVIYSAIATVIGTVAGYLVSRFNDWLKINSISLGIIFVVAIVCGYTGYQFGTIAFPHVARVQLSFFSAVLGVILGGAWVSTHRSFSMPRTNEPDAG